MKLHEALKKRDFLPQFNSQIGIWDAGLGIEDEVHETLKFNFVLRNEMDWITIKQQWFSFDCDDDNLIEWFKHVKEKLLNEFEVMNEFGYVQDENFTYSKNMNGALIVVCLSWFVTDEILIYRIEDKNMSKKKYDNDDLISNILDYEVTNFGFSNLNPPMRDELIKRDMVKECGL